MCFRWGGYPHMMGSVTDCPRTGSPSGNYRNRKATKKENGNRHITRASQLHDLLNDIQESSGQRSQQPDNNEKRKKILIKMHETKG
jgi:hypothetical protein